jgi:hypothetical protein
MNNSVLSTDVSEECNISIFRQQSEPLFCSLIPIFDPEDGSDIFLQNIG